MPARSYSIFALGNRYTFQAREIDRITGLTYLFRARWYDPNAGRWISKDLIRIADGLNPYVFCENNLVMFVDPMGLFGVVDFLAGLSIGLGVASTGVAIHTIVWDKFFEPEPMSAHEEA